MWNLKTKTIDTFTYEYAGDSVSMKTPNSIIQMPDSKDGNNENKEIKKK
jgi:hypothetical protein